MKSVYTLVGAIASAALPAYAQNISESETAPAHGQSHRPALEHVLVSMPAHKKEAKTALPIYRLDGDELQRAAAQNLGDTLAGQPGVNSASFGPAVGQPVIRGHMGPRVQVLQNSL
ncbi:MAG: TonB-dependent receptor plug domain-containing protein, partial [Spongiibacter sp.]